MTEIVVDTDVISFGFRNDSRFTFYMPHMQGLRPLMSFMTSAEIEFGIRRRNWGHLKTESELTGRILPEADAWNAALAVLIGMGMWS